MTKDEILKLRLVLAARLILKYRNTQFLSMDGSMWNANTAALEDADDLMREAGVDLDTGETQ